MQLTSGANSQSSLLDRDVGTLLVTTVNLSWARNFLLRVKQHLLPLGHPSGCAGDGEQYREHRYREAHRLVDQPGVEVHVGIKLAADEIVLLQGNPLALQRDFAQRVAARYLEDLIGNVLDYLGARVVVLVD